MIEVRGLTKRFGPVTAVDGLSFTVRPGRGWPVAVLVAACVVITRRDA